MSDHPTIFLLYEEVSDQYGTDRVAGVFTTRAKAEIAEQQITQRRSFVREMPLDPMVVPHA